MTDLVEKIGSAYEDASLIRGLVNLIPLGIGSAVDQTLTTELRLIRERRLREFFDALGAGEVELTPDLIESEDFLHCYFRTLDAVARTRRRGKIRYLARLLRAAAGPTRPESVDEYEELLQLIDDLSARELTILAILGKHQALAPQEGSETPVQRAERYWTGFIEEVEVVLGLPGEILIPMITRLQRSGLIAEITGAYWNYVGGKAALTPLYYRLEKYVGSYAIDDAAIEELRRPGSDAV